MLPTRTARTLLYHSRVGDASAGSSLLPAFPLALGLYLSVPSETRLVPDPRTYPHHPYLTECHCLPKEVAGKHFS